MADAPWTQRVTGSALLCLPIVAALDVGYGVAARPWHPSTARAAIAAILLAFGLVTVAMVALAALQCGALGALHRITRAFPPRLRRVAPSLLGSVLAAPVLLLLARIPFAGTRYRGTALATYGPWVTFVALVVAVALLCLAATWLIERLDATERRPDRPWLVAMLLAAAGVSFAIDTHWQVPWYPEMHAVLAGATVTLLHLGVFGIARQRPGAFRAAWRTLPAVLAVGAICIWVGVSLRTSTTTWRVRTGTVFASRLLSNVPALDRHDLTARLSSLDVVPPADDVPAPPRESAGSRVGQVLLYTADTLRRDAVGLYSRHTGTTPHVDAYFARGRRFSRAYAQYAATRHSVWAMFHGRYKHQDDGVWPDENLITVLRDHGRRAVAVLPVDLRIYVNMERYNFVDVEFYHQDAELPAALRRVLSRVREAPDFLWVHAYTPHAPYSPPPALASAAGSRARYRGEVRWMDLQFAETLEVLGPSASRLVIFGSDHGEEFGEHGATLHGHSAYEEVIGVPLMLAGPLVPDDVVDVPVANIDIAPTVLDAFAVPVPIEFQGRSLLSAPEPGRWIFAETVNDRIMVVRDWQKWIVDTRTGEEERYDLRTDPAEVNNLLDEAVERDEGRGRAWAAWLAGEGRHWLREASRETTRASRLAPVARCLALVDTAQRLAADHPVDVELERLLAGASDLPCRASALSALEGTDQLPSWVCAAVSTDDAVHSIEAIEIPRLRALARCRTRRDLMERSMASPSSRIRAAALEALAITGPTGMAFAAVRPTAPAPGGSLDAALAAAEPWMRAAAARLLVHAPPAYAAQRLEHLVEHDGSPRVRAAAILAGYQMDPTLGHRLAQRECHAPALPDVERVRVLVETRDARHAEYLVRLFEASRSAELRAYISRGLFRLAGAGQDRQRLHAFLREAVRDPALHGAIGRLARVAP